MTNRPTAKQIASRGLIFQAQVGSRVHGTSVGGDDRDEMGICIEPQDHVMGLWNFDQYIFRTAQERTGNANPRSEADDLDLTVYGLRKFVRLASGGNPSILTLLYSPEDMIIFASPIGRGLLANHDMFHHRGAASRFLGYIEGQRKRMVGERSKSTNRPELIEAYGFDTKYAGHIVRLAVQGVEYMTTGRMNLPMEEPWRSWICDVRVGKHTEQEALEVCADFENQLKVLRDTADMPEHVDIERINKWLVAAYRMGWTGAL